MNKKTNALTADAATQRGALQLRALQLIGIFGPAEAPRALLRAPNGQISNIGLNDQVPLGNVVGIGEDRIVIATKTGERTLRLPAPRATAA